MRYQANVAVLPMLAEATHDSVMISQMLYGETCELISKDGFFARIRMDFDGMEGFVEFHCLQEEESQQKRLIQSTYQFLEGREGGILFSIGSEIPQQKLDSAELAPDLPEMARQFLNVPFLQGGRSFFGVDAGGLIQLIFKIKGIKLPRIPSEQAIIGEVLDFLEESLPGDLAFFENAEGEINHVGIISENGTVIHAYGKVRRDYLDSSGIYNQQLKMHTHKLRFVRRIS